MTLTDFISLPDVKEYLLTVEANGGEIRGEGWYGRGSTATATAVSPAKVEEQRSRLLFTQWSGDKFSLLATPNVRSVGPG